MNHYLIIPKYFNSLENPLLPLRSRSAYLLDTCQHTDSRS